MLPVLPAPQGPHPSQVYPEMTCWSSLTPVQVPDRDLSEADTNFGSGLTSGPGSPRSPGAPLTPAVPGAPYRGNKHTHGFTLSQQDEHQGLPLPGWRKTGITYRKSTTTFLSNFTWFSLKYFKGKTWIKQSERRIDGQTVTCTDLKFFGSFSIKFDSFLSRDPRWSTISLGKPNNNNWWWWRW